jgi:hypothetical protein
VPPELEENFEPLRRLGAFTHHLPVQVSSFLGRVEELILGAKLLADHPLLSVVGPGGAGKTRVAFQLAEAQLSQFPDGVWVVELASEVDPQRIPALLLSGLGLRDEPGRTATETIVSYLRDRRALVVLDNCEHLVDAAASFASELLGACGQLAGVGDEPGGVADGGRVGMATRSAPVAGRRGDRPRRDRGQPTRWRCFVSGLARPLPVSAWISQRGDSDEDLPSPGGDAAGDRAGRGVGSHPSADPDRRAPRAQPGPALQGISPGCRSSFQPARHLDLVPRFARPDRAGALSATGRVCRRLHPGRGGSVGAGEGLDVTEVLDALDGLVDKSLVG